VDELHRHRALADGAGHALDRLVAHVARHEDAGQRRLEQVGVARWLQRGAPPPPFAIAPVTSGPESTKPRVSRATDPASQSVRGWAPMKMNSDEAARCSDPSGVATVMDSRWSSPWASVTWAWVRTSIVGMPSICWIR
jgi:hypothetical protein